MLNLNVGILGHVDSGKTSLAKSLSQVASTAAFDKNPQSQERGITLDLGFSSFSIEKPAHLAEVVEDDRIQFTLVDCPGHASLIRTVIGGAQIIDVMLLVIDVTKGIQTQTAECIIIGELTCKVSVIVLNKIDHIPPGNEKKIEKMTKKIRGALSSTVFKDAPLVYTAANPDVGNPQGIEDLVNAMSNCIFLPKRNKEAPFLMAVDHCFGIRGHGSVMTGTILQGSVQVNDVIQIPSLCVTKKVKSIQVFRKPVQGASQGDRVGICVTQFDAKSFERGIICTTDFAAKAYAVLITAEKIKYFKFPIKTKSKFHISIGHETVMALITCFSLEKNFATSSDDFNFDLEYKYSDELSENESATKDNENKDGDDKVEQELATVCSSENKTRSNTENGETDVVKTCESKNGDTEGKSLESCKENYKNPEGDSAVQFLLLEFETPVITVPKSLVIGSKLDLYIQGSNCRLAFWGRALEIIKDKNYRTTILPQLKIYKIKKKEGSMDRLINNFEIIVKNMFKKEANVQKFVGLKVNLSTGETGKIEGQFGQSGKIKVHIQSGLSESTVNILQNLGKKHKNLSPVENVQPVKVTLEFKKYVFDAQKLITQ